MFGYLSYVHLDPARRSKLDPKSKKCFFIGYGDTEFGSHFWDDQNQKIIRSRNFIFNEEIMYQDMLSTGSECAWPELKEAGMILLNDIPVDDMKNID